MASDDACSFAIDATTITGVCQRDPMGSLVCIPSGPPPGRGRLNAVSRNPVYVPAEVHHEGRVWKRVGIRYKGNSSLASSRRQGIAKLPFRLHFDKFEDNDPEVRDRRFHGFRELSFSSNWGDDSMLRECFTKEVFRDRGIPAPRCAFYRVHVDTGRGPTYWGLYSLVEDPDDGAMLDAQFGGRGGNLYKPEGPGSDWTRFDPSGFEKKTNAGAADWSDVKLAIEALHSPVVESSTYRSQLEARFDAPLFISWLAVNTVIHNWDSYGRGAHNYYLYGDPGRSGQLRWIPWDHNLAMMLGPPGRQRPLGPDPSAAAAASSLFHSRAGRAWPLISRLLADPTYARSYREEVERALHGLFAEDTGRGRLMSLHRLVRPHVIGDDGERAPYSTISSEEAFEDSIEGRGGLSEVISQRHRVVRLAIGQN